MKCEVKSWKKTAAKVMTTHVWKPWNYAIMTWIRASFDPWLQRLSSKMPSGKRQLRSASSDSRSNQSPLASGTYIKKESPGGLQSKNWIEYVFNA